ncbi:hypothetical protein B0I08_101295 [Glaciihabitans tibetensis]|uniref:Histone acetyltransferase Rv0428c-like SH3 domain-containing protein n=1 Tax=Glaciihabitans tibetensis TaxID=1266600 RepID=A0A2T0VIX2_9MICO|nr:ferrous iron transport protein A [Glaciihabitans tibetensis]PRY70167.1 hypothetical protein B0I08_101295 [Glaciihabitans tibetensis]
MGAAAVAIITGAELGSRLVVRYRIEGGATDALGYLRARTQTTCTIETRRGDRVVLLAEVVAAKPVPEPPEPRRPRFPTTFN